MRETEFIDQNKEKWQKLEKLSASKEKDPELLSELFIEATNDLSYSKSYYPNRSIRVYLNKLALKVHSNVYRTRKSTWKRVMKLWMEQIPQAYYEARRTVLFSFIIFFAGVAIGAFSAAQDPGFVGLMFSDGYLEMTMENIEKGKPMDVYAGDSQMNMFAAITLNNIRVSFVVFVLGLFFMVGTIGALIQNGAMLGAFHFLFYENGYLGESLLTVWMHGTPEIGAIILAGAAGMELGRGLIFPGTYTRKESFLLGAKKGVLLLIGVVPVFVFAGFVEGFATRYTDVPDLVRLLFILICAAFMLSYFVIMPRRKFRHAERKSVAEEQVPEARPHDFGLNEVKSHGRIFSDSFALYSSQFTSYIIPALGAGILFVTSLYFYLGDQFTVHLSNRSVFGLSEFFRAMAQAFYKLDKLYQLGGYPVLFLMDSLIISTIVVLSLVGLRRFFKQEIGFNLPKVIAWSILVSMISHLFFFLPSPWSFILFLGFSPLLLTAAIMPLIPDLDGSEKWSRYWISVRTGYLKLLGQVLVLFSCATLFMVFFNSGLTDYLLQTILNGFKMEAQTYENLIVGINALFTIWGLCMVIPLFLYAAYFSFWSDYEIDTAKDLNEQISRIGLRDKAYGILRED